MIPCSQKKQELTNKGFTIVDKVYSIAEISQLIALIDQADISKETFRKSANLFAIRQFLKEVPGAMEILLNSNFKALVKELGGKDYFVVKSIYFDKPAQSNWFVAYHQDLTISVDRKMPLKGYGPWTVKQDQFAVQPPMEVLENIITVRIHLDDTNEHNGALKVIPGSHVKNICRSDDISDEKQKEVTCSVKRGDVMVMKPLLLHSSGRTVNQQQRRVIHIELSNRELPSAIQWSERLDLNHFSTH